MDAEALRLYNSLSKKDIAIAPVKFWTAYEQDPAKPGHLRSVDYVRWTRKGSNGATTDEKIARLSKKRDGFSDPIWDALQPYYDAWKKGQEAPANGTPLAAWPGCSPEMAESLKLLHLLTVEDVADMNEATLERVGMGARAMRDQARAFVKAQEGQAVIAVAMAEKDKQLQTQADQIAELQRTVAELQSILPQKPKPQDMAKKAG